MGVNWVRMLVPALAMAATPLAAATVVMTPSTVNSALAQLRPGDTLRLEGNFTTRLAIQNRDFGGVTIDGSRAVLVQGMNLRNIQNVTFTGLTVGVAGQGTINRFAVNLDGGSHVSFAESRFLGIGGSAGTGLRIINSSFATVRDTQFDGWLDGMTLISSPDSLVTRNQFTTGGSDGVKVVDSHRIILSGNSCSGFTIQPGVHPDCIQFISRVDKPVQSDIFVLNNSVIGNQQGFASFDPAGFSGTRFTFAGNYVAVSRPQGIACFGCTDSVFVDNVIVTLPDAQWQTKLQVPNGSNNVFSNNLNVDLRGIGAPLEAVLPSRLYSAIVPDIAGMVGSRHDSREWRIYDTAMQSRGAGPVPEPAAWIMLLAGFGLIGRMLRARQPLRTVFN
jgi:hypothetical protein